LFKSIGKPFFRVCPVQGFVSLSPPPAQCYAKEFIMPGKILVTAP
jgi:hypothetical protein